MRYACLSCGKEREIRVQDAWPANCECGSTSWTTAPLAFASTVAPIATGTLDPVAAANAALRQPGAPRIPAPHY